MDGQRKHIDQLFEQEQQNFIQYVRRKVTGISEMDAEDIVAEVLFNVFNRVNVEEYVENLTAYIYRSIKNKVVDFLRKPQQPVSLDLLNELNDSTLAEQIADPNADIDQILLKKEVLSQIHAALMELKPNQRDVWIATEIEGHSFKALSRKLNEPIGTLLSRKNRAAKKLQKLLKDIQIP